MCNSSTPNLVVSVGKGGSGRNCEAATTTVPRCIPAMALRRLLAEDVGRVRESPSSAYGRRRHHVVIVMDPLKDFCTVPLEWALRHVVEPGDMLTLLGVMPWLNLALSCKTWLDIWTLDLRNVTTFKERSEWRHDAKYQRLRGIVKLCEAHGVIPSMKVVMGHPVRLIVLEQTTYLHATWVIFDRHQRRRRGFYRRRIPCNMVMMNAAGKADMLKVRLVGETSTQETCPAWALPAPELISSKEWTETLKKDPNQEVDRA